MTDPILEYKQKPLEGYGTSNENLINIVPYNDLFGKLGALADTPAPANLQMPDLSKLLTQPQIPGPLAKLDLGYQNPTDNLWAKSTETLRQKNPDLFNPVHRVTALPGSFIKEYTNTDSNYNNMFTRAAGQFSKGAIVGGAVGGTIGLAGGGIGSIPGWGVGAIIGGVGSLLGLMETSGKQGFKFNVNNQEETSQKQSGFFNTLGGFTNNVVDRSFEASVGGTAALLATPFGAMAGKDFYNMGENPLSSYLANSLEESEFKMKLSNNYLNKGPIAKFFTREGFSNDIADMVGFTVGMIAGTKMQGGANLVAGKITGLGAEALGFTESAAKMSTVGLLRSPSGFLLGRNTTLANQAGLTATKGLSAITTGKNIALAADELIPMFKSGFGGGIKQLATGIYSKGLKAGVSDVFSNYGTKLTNIFKDGSVGLSYLKNFERTALASYGEARVEGLQTYQNVYDSAIKNGYTPEQAIEKATKAANKALFGNMVLLGITNQVALNNLIESPSRLKSLSKWFDDAWKYDGSTRNILKNALTIKGDSLLKNVGRNFLIEGFVEELGQHAISEGAKNYIMNKNNPIHQSYWGEFIDAYKEGLSSDEGISNWFGGGLFGAAMGLGGGGLSLMRDKKAAKEYSLEPGFMQRVSKFETATEFFANHMSPFNGQIYSTYSENEINGQKVYEENIDGDLRFVDDPTRIVKLYQALSHINKLSDDQSKVLTSQAISNLSDLNENDPKYADQKEAISSLKDYFDYLDFSEKMNEGRSDSFSKIKEDLNNQISEIDDHLKNTSLDPLVQSNLNTTKEQLVEQLNTIDSQLSKIKGSRSMIEASKKETPKSIADYAEANKDKKVAIMKGLQILHNTSQEYSDMFSFKNDLEPLYVDLVKTNHVADYVTRGVEEKLFAELDAFEKDLTTSDNLTFMGASFKDKDEVRYKISEFKKSLEEQVDLYKKILFRYGNPVTTAILKNKDDKNFKHNVYVDTKALLRSAIAQRHLSDKYRKNEELKNNIQLETILNNPELYKKYLDPKFTYNDLLKDIDKGVFAVTSKKDILDYTPEVLDRLDKIEEEYNAQVELLKNNPNDSDVIAKIAELQKENDDVLANNSKVKQTIDVEDYKKTKEITDPIEESFKKLKAYQANQKEIQDMLNMENELYLRHTNIDWIVSEAQKHELIYQNQATDKSKAPEEKKPETKKKTEVTEQKAEDSEDFVKDLVENLPIEENVKSKTTDINKERYDKILEVYNNLQQEISDEEGLTGDDLIIATDNEMSLAYPDDFAFKVLYEKIQKEIEELRAKEQAELDEKIPNAEQYRVNNRVDKNKLTNDEDIAAYNKIYEVYNKLITDLTKQLTPDTTVTPNQSDIEAKKADIEKRRQKSLTTFTYKDLKGSDMTIAESVISYADGTTEIVSDILDVTNKDSHWRLKQTINTKYDAEYVDAVNKGEMTKEQAMQALEEIGRKNSAAYTELNTLKESTQTIPTFIISKKYVINGVVATFKSLNKKGTYTFTDEKGGNISENRPEILSSIVEYIPSQTSQTIKEDIFGDDAGEEQQQEESTNPNKNPKVPLTPDNLYKAFGNENDINSSPAHKAFRSLLNNPNELDKYPNLKLFAIPLNHPIANNIFDQDDKDWYKKNGLPEGGQVIYIYVNDNKVITYKNNKYVLSNITIDDLFSNKDIDLSDIPYNKSMGYTTNQNGDLVGKNGVSEDTLLYNLLYKDFAKPKDITEKQFKNGSDYIQYIKSNGLYEDVKTHLSHINKLIETFNSNVLDLDRKKEFLSLNIIGIGKGTIHEDARGKFKKLDQGSLVQSTETKVLLENGKPLLKNAFYFKKGNYYHLTFRKTLASIFNSKVNDPSNPFNRDHLKTVLSKAILAYNNDGTNNPIFLKNDVRQYLKILLGVSVLDYQGVTFENYKDEKGNYDISNIVYPGSSMKIDPINFKNNRLTFAIDGDMRIIAFYGKNSLGQIVTPQIEYTDGTIINRASENKIITDFVDNVLKSIESKPIPINFSRLNQSKTTKQQSSGTYEDINIPIVTNGEIEINKSGSIKTNTLKYIDIIFNNEIVTYLPSTITDKNGNTVSSRINRYPLYKANTLNETPVTITSTSLQTNQVDLESLISQKEAEINAAYTIGVEDSIIEKLMKDLRSLQDKRGSGADKSGYRVNLSNYSDIENITEFSEWLSSVLPQFTVQSSANKIDNIAQGQYIKNLIKIWEGAETGTGFHEAFEAVWFNMLSPKEQSDLINEFKDREGSFTYFVDSRIINYKDATNLEAKEMLAEGFREFMLTGKQFKPKTLSFFRRLLDLLKSFINNIISVFGNTNNAETFINDIYQKIADGDFKDFTITNYSKETGYRNYGEDVISYITTGVLKSIHGEVMNKVRSNLSLNMYDIVEDKDKKELSKELKEIIDTSFNKVTKSFADWCKLANEPEYNIFFSTSNAGLNIFNPKYTDQLKQDYLDSFFNDTLLADKSDFEEYAEENKKTREGIKEDTEIDPLSKVRPVISFLLSNLRYIDNDGNFEKSARLRTDTGYEMVVAYKTPNLETVKSLLVSNLKDIVLHKKFVKINETDFIPGNVNYRKRKDGFYKIEEIDLFSQYISKIDEIIKRDPIRFSYLKDLKSQLKTDIDYNLLSEADKQLRISFVSSFNLTGFTPITYTISSMGNDINDVMYDESANKMISSWKVYAKQILENVLYAKKIRKFELSENPFLIYNNGMLFSENREIFLNLIKFKEEYKDYSFNPKVPASNKIKALQSLGIIFSEENLYENNETKETLINPIISEEINQLLAILLLSNETTMSLDDFYKYVGTKLRTLASTVGNIEGEAYLSFLGPEGEMQYTVINPSTESNIVNKLNSIKYWDELIHNFPFWFQKDGNLKPGLRNNLFLSQNGLLFTDGNKNSTKFERILISGLKDRDKNSGQKYSDASILSQRVVAMNALFDGIFSSGINADKSMENGYKLISEGINNKKSGLLSNSLVMPIRNYAINNELSKVIDMYKSQVLDELDSYFNKDANIKNVNKLDGLLVFKDRLPKLQQLIVDKKIISSIENDINPELTNYFKRKDKEGFAYELQVYLDNKNRELVEELDNIDQNIFNYRGKFSYSTLATIFPNIELKVNKFGKESLVENDYFVAIENNMYELTDTGVNVIARMVNATTDLIINDFVKMKSGDFSALKVDDHSKRANAPSSSKIGRDLSKNTLNTLNNIFPATVGVHRAKLNFISLQDSIVVSKNLTNRMEKLYSLASKILKDKDGNPMSDEKLFKMLGARFENGKLVGDEKITGSVYNTYQNLDMADAQAWCLPKLYSNLFFSSGMLSKEKKKQLQYEMAVERQERSLLSDPDLKYVYTDDSLKTFDENILLNEEEYNTGAILEVIKPFGFGFHRNTNLSVGALLKNSIALLTWNRVKNNPELAKQYVMWQNADIDVIGHESGQKQGVLLKSDNTLHPLFNEDGNRNLSLPNNYIQSIEGEHFGFQVEMHDKLKYESTLGSQLSNIIIGDLKGFLDDNTNTFLTKKDKERISKNIDDYLDIQNALIFTGKQKALDKLGLREIYTDNKVTGYETNDIKQLAKTLEQSAKTLKVTINTMDLFKLVDGKFQYYFETAPKSDSIEYILNSIIDKAAIHQKVKGTQAPQVSSEMMRTNATWKDFVYVDSNGIFSNFKSEKLFKAFKGKTYPVSNTLKLREDGTLEVMLPSFFKGKVDIGKLDKRLLEYVGYRIPTQSLGQIEAIEVVGFLEDTWGNAIIVPAEIVGKAGSDFDIDKLNMYMPHYANITNEDGSETYEYIEYDNNPSENAVLNRYSIYTNKLQKVFRFLSTLDNIIAKDYEKNVLNLTSSNAGDKLILNIFKNITDDISPYDDQTIDEVLKENNFSLELYNKVQEQYDFLKNKYMSFEIFKTLPISHQNTREQLENRNIQLIRSLTLEPINQLRHLMPNGSKNLKEYSIDINKDIEEKALNFSDLFTFMGRTKSRYTVINAKSLVGKGATNIPTHSISQNGELILNTDNFNSDILNKMTKEEGIALYNVLDKNGYLISATLSEFLSAFVDGAKDPFIMNLNVSRETVSRLLLLIRMGVTPEVALRFINQPLIKEYSIILQNSNDLTNKYMYRKYDLEPLNKEYKAMYNFFRKNESYINQLKGDNAVSNLNSQFLNNIKLFMDKASIIQFGGDMVDSNGIVFESENGVIKQAQWDIQQIVNSFDIVNGERIYTGKGILGTLKDNKSDFWKLINLEYNPDPKSNFNLAILEEYGKNPKNKNQAMNYLQFQVGLLMSFKNLEKPAMALGEANAILNAHSSTTKTLRDNEVMITKKNKMLTSPIGLPDILNMGQALLRSNQKAIYDVREDSFKMLSNYLLTADPNFLEFIKLKTSEIGNMSSGDMTKYMSTYSNFALSYMVHNYSSFKDKIDDIKKAMFNAKNSQSIISKINKLKNSNKDLYNNKFKGVFDNLSLSSVDIVLDTTMNNISLYNPKQPVENRNAEIIKYEDAYKIATMMKAEPKNATQAKYAQDMLDMLELLCNFSIYQHGLINTMSSYQDTLPSGLYANILNKYLVEIQPLLGELVNEKKNIDKLLAQNYFYMGLFVKYADKPLNVPKQGRFITKHFNGALTLFEEVKEMDFQLAESLAQNDIGVLNGYASEDEVYEKIIKFKYQPIEILGNRGKYIAFSSNNPTIRENTAIVKDRSFISKEYDQDDLDARQNAMVSDSVGEAFFDSDADLAAREEALIASQNQDFEIIEDINPFEEFTPFEEAAPISENIPFKEKDVVRLIESGEEGDILKINEDGTITVMLDTGEETFNVDQLEIVNTGSDKDAKC